ncbi:glycosyltransferase [Bacteroides sp.]|uniref:glycosyltransferase n=1 Tax=Bacteroides sp. TaxID=29523 RepID=UPI003A8D9DC7
MKVLQTIPNMWASWGGPCTCTRDLLDGLYEIGVRADLLSSDSRCNDEHVLGKGLPWMKLLPFDWKTPLALSSNFKRYLLENDYDIYHANTIWLYPTHITCKVARKKKRPYVLSPHGMLYPTALKMNAWKKWPMKKLWFDKDIMNASCLHATCEQEMKYIREYGYCGPVAVIPNPVVFPHDVHLKTVLPAQKSIGYLGRLHPIKNIERLLEATAEVVRRGHTDFRVEIMGKGTDKYENFLHSEVWRLGLEGKVDFIGFVSGKEKYDKLAMLRAMFVPSVQENFGMIVPEALICGTPVYASLGTPWKELNDYDCGWWQNNDIATIADVIENILQKKDDELLGMGHRGRVLMESKYEQHKVAHMMCNVYEWLLDKTNKPSYVYE